MKMTNSLIILVVEDDAIVAEDIVLFLEGLGHKVLGPAYNTTDAMRLVMEHKPQLALLDIHLEGCANGIEFAGWLRSTLPIPIVFLTAYADKNTLTRAKQLHPEYYIVKPFNKQQLKAAIEVAAENYYNHNARLEIERKIFRFNMLLPEPLSEREIDVVNLLLNGFNNGNIAKKLFLSENTVKSHLKNIFIKTGVQSRTELLSQIIHC